MKICDNFDNIYSLLEFNNEGDYYVITLIIRKEKDNNQDSEYLYYMENKKIMGGAIPKFFLLYKKEDLYKYKNEIIKLSELYNARAYIYLQPRNIFITYKNILKNISDSFFYNNFQKNLDVFIYNNLINYNIDNKNLYLVDIDPEYISYKDFIYNYLKQNNKNIIELNSLVGIHFIVDNIDEFDFNTKFPDIRLHMNRPTLLYYKSDID